MQPIRKISHDLVALTSYYGKTFVSRNDKKSNDYGGWLRRQVMEKGLDNTDTSIVNLHPANVFDNTFESPKTYSTIAMGFRGFTSQGFNFIFDHKERLRVFTPEEIKTYEVDGSRLVANDTTGALLVLDKHNTLYQIVDSVLTPKGTIEQFINVSVMTAPVEYCQVKVFGKNIPIAIILGYKLGLQELLNKLKVTPRRVPAGQRLHLQEHEYEIAFSDETLIFSKDDTLACMVLAGLREFDKSTRRYSSGIFNKPNVYLNILESTGIGSRYLREIDLMDDLFVDPITEELLKEMNEPTSFRGLLIRSAELLLLDKHPDALDMAHMRIKGYERLAGGVYTELVNSLREHRARAGRANQAVELNPHAVWIRVAQDPSITMVSDINPVENLKQMEAVTYAGTGGRNSRSMTKHARAYHENDMGVISESTSDSADVAVNTFTSADPQFNSVRGTTKRYEIGKTGATALLSTSALLSVGSDKDDPKRVFISSLVWKHT